MMRAMKLSIRLPINVFVYIRDPNQTEFATYVDAIHSMEYGLKPRIESGKEGGGRGERLCVQSKIAFVFTTQNVNCYGNCVTSIQSLIYVAIARQSLVNCGQRKYNLSKDFSFFSSMFYYLRARNSIGFKLLGRNQIVSLCLRTVNGGRNKQSVQSCCVFHVFTLAQISF